MYGSCEGAPALPEDVWLHLLGSVPPEDVVFFHGLLNTSYFHRSVFVKHILVQSGLRPSAEDVSRCCKVNPLAPADIWATLIQEKWGMRMYAGDFISSVVHATRLASTRQIFHQYVVAIPYIRFLALNHQLIEPSIDCLFSYFRWSVFERWWDRFFEAGDPSLPVLRRLAQNSEHNLTPSQESADQPPRMKVSHSISREVWAELQHLNQNEDDNSCGL
jgi:hypothetical protein